ncbi:MAG: hypothetical protein NVS9B4_25500 [Candidatus Acidiferrum sp.]
MRPTLAKLFDNAMLAEWSAALAPQLPAYLLKQRWFGGKARQLRSANVFDVVPMRQDGFVAFVIFARVEYADGGKDVYAIPLCVAESPSSPSGQTAPVLLINSEQPGEKIALRDALREERFALMLLEAVKTTLAFSGHASEIRASRTSALTAHDALPPTAFLPRPIKAEQSNTSIIYGDRLILKFYRRLEDGINPDLEIGTFLTERAQFPHTPQLLGYLQCHGAGGSQSTQAILQSYVPNQGDAWHYTLQSVSAFYDQALNRPGGAQPEAALLEFARDSIASYLDSVALLATRTAELHHALASDAHDPAFAPEPFDQKSQGTFEASLVDLTQRTFVQLRERILHLPQESRAKADQVLNMEAEIDSRFRSALRSPIRATRIRIHGDYHLGQVLYTGSDFVILDFEGEPARPLSARRAKRSPLQDVAGMLRSFHYAAYAPLLSPADATKMDKFAALTPWAESWNKCVTDRFLQTYLQTAGGAHYLPQSHAEIYSLLQIHLLEKAVYELGYELNNRPTWVGIPLEGLLKTMAAAASAT